MDFIRRPRDTGFRRIVFQIHLWSGLGIGLYLFVMSLTGVVLVFEDEINAWVHPDLYHVRDRGRPAVTMDTLIGSVRSSYPEHRIYRIYAPTSRRDTYVVMVEKQGEFVTTFAEPASGQVLGVKPKHSFVRGVWEVHANLLGGFTGRAVNCTLGLLAILVAATGLIVWWPGAVRWWRALGVSNRGSPMLVARSLHGAVGVWTFVFIVMFATTGALYYFGPQFFWVLGPVSRLSQENVRYSNSPSEGQKPPIEYQALIAQAEAASRGKELFAVIPPWSDKSSIRVIVGPPTSHLGASDWEWRHTGNRYFYYDQYTGELLGQWDMTNPTLADAIRSWLAPLHRGSFGGRGVTIVWAIAGLAPALLFVLGVAMWWTRVVRRKAGRTRDA
jgi:uncharacterized iron-regulated membrane protein